MFGGAAVFVVTFFYRFSTIAFANDHFMHLAEAQQMLSGEWPVRDFFDFGLPLQVIASAVSLTWSGHNLFGEAVLTVGFVAAGAALTFVMSWRLSRSVTMGVAAAIVTIASEPRLYSYPKVFLYVTALWLALRYAEQPTVRRLSALGLLTGIAFLFRHDHAAYIAVSVMVMLIALNGLNRRFVARSAIYAATAASMVLPFFAWVQIAAGTSAYLSDLAFGASVSTTPRFNWLPFTFNPAERLIAFSPPVRPRVNVRWAPAIDAGIRTAKEQRYSLDEPVQITGTTWSYVPRETGPSTLRALLNESVVVDTNGIDRSTSTLEVRESWSEWMTRHIPLLRLRLAPSLTSAANALAWYYYVTFLTPVVAGCVWAHAAWTGRISRTELAIVAMSVVMSLIVVQTLVRGSPDSRLPDVTGTVAISGAWVAARWLRHARRLSVRPLIAGVVFWLTVWSVSTYTAAGQTLAASRFFDGPAAMHRQLAEMSRRLRQRPIDGIGDDASGVEALSRYAYECTRADERLLVTWFEPLIYFYAERQFAGGMPFFDNGWFDAPRAQRLVVERLRRQRVPLVFIREDQEAVFRRAFPIVASYVDEHYEELQPTADGSRLTGYHVRVDRGRTSTGTYSPLGLPCFVASPSVRGVSSLTE